MNEQQIKQHVQELKDLAEQFEEAVKNYETIKADLAALTKPTFDSRKIILEDEIEFFIAQEVAFDDYEKNKKTAQENLDLIESRINGILKQIAERLPNQNMVMPWVIIGKLAFHRHPSFPFCEVKPIEEILK